MNAAELQAVQAELDDHRREAAHPAARKTLGRCADDPGQLAVDMAEEL